MAHNDQDILLEAVEFLSAITQRLILEAEGQLARTEKLEEQLSLLHELFCREGSSVSAARSEILSELWTMLGGNRRKLKGFEDHLALLKGLGEYRKEALARVVLALQTLRALSDDVEDLRERFVEAQLGEFMSAEVHMKSIAMGLQRLKDSRVRARAKEEETIRLTLGSA